MHWILIVIMWSNLLGSAGYSHGFSQTFETKKACIEAANGINIIKAYGVDAEAFCVEDGIKIEPTKEMVK